MRKFIDAHVHIMPAARIGYTDHYINATYSPFGKMHYYDGTVSQKMPVLLKDSNFDAEMLIAFMDDWGVERSVIMQNGSPAFTEATLEAVQRWPRRLAGAIAPDFAAEDPIGDLERYRAGGIKVIKMLLADDTGLMCPARFPDFRLDAPEVFAYLGKAQELDMAVAIDIYGVHTCGYQIEAFEKAVASFPNLKFVFCHLGLPPFKKSMQEDSEKRWLRLIDLGEHDNVWFDLAAMPEILSSSAYPYPEVVPVVKRVADRFGAKRLIWGSDMPETLSNTTYRQMLDVYEKSDLFTEQEKDMIFYENAREVYF